MIGVSKGGNKSSINNTNSLKQNRSNIEHNQPSESMKGTFGCSLANLLLLQYNNLFWGVFFYINACCFLTFTKFPLSKTVERHNFCTFAAFSFNGEYVVRSLLPNGV